MQKWSNLVTFAAETPCDLAIEKSEPPSLQLGNPQDFETLIRVNRNLDRLISDCTVKCECLSFVSRVLTYLKARKNEISFRPSR